MTEAMQDISREFHGTMVAYIRTVSVDIISPVQVLPVTQRWTHVRP